MTDQSSAPSMTRPRPGPTRDTVTKLENHLGDVLGRHVAETNAADPVLTIAQQLKALTYDEAQEVGQGLAKAIEANKDKDTGFDFSNAPIKLAPVLTHLVQTWASTVAKPNTD